MRRARARLLVLFALLLMGLVLPASVALTYAEGAGSVRADALVLVNSASPAYPDFEHYVKPYLENYGVPYTVVDIASTAVPTEVGAYALVVVGHRQLDLQSAYLDAAEDGTISAAINAGTGLINFDNDLWTATSTSRYQFVRDAFNFGRGGVTSGSGVAFTGASHYITERHWAGESIDTGAMTLAGITLPPAVTALALTGSQPTLAATTYGSGRAVQWGTYDWASTSVHGPVLRPGRPRMAEHRLGGPEAFRHAGIAASGHDAGRR